MSDHPEVITRPPYLLFFFLLLSFGMNRVLALPLEFPLSTLWLGRGACIGAVLWIAWAIRTMRKHKTNVDPYQPTLNIVSTGPFATSRNPIYLGLVIFYLGCAFYFKLGWAFLFFPLFLISLLYGVILREEKYLESKFGKQYLDYKKSVRRWI